MRPTIAGAAVALVMLAPYSAMATPEQQATLADALSGFPFTALERSACSADYSVALGFADLPSGNAHQYVDNFKGCVLQERTRQKAAEARRATARGAAEAKQAETQKQEEARRAAAIEEASLSAAAEAMVAKPQVAQAILSAFLCDSTQARTEKLQAIAKDKRYSATGGAVDLRRRLDLQDELRAQDDRIGALKVSLRTIKRPALPCKSPAVAAMSACMFDQEETEDCKAISAVLARAAKMLSPTPDDE